VIVPCAKPLGLSLRLSGRTSIEPHDFSTSSARGSTPYTGSMTLLPLDWLQLAIDIASGLAHLHRCGFAHRDLKLENILIDSDGYLKIIDYGLAKMIG
jgi:serine/threonine protein kinase